MSADPLRWPGMDAATSDDAGRDALALVRATLRQDRHGVRAVLAGRGLDQVTAELAVIGELTVLCAELARRCGGDAEATLREYQAQVGL